MFRPYNFFSITSALLNVYWPFKWTTHMLFRKHPVFGKVEVDFFCFTKRVSTLLLTCVRLRVPVWSCALVPKLLGCRQMEDCSLVSCIEDISSLLPEGTPSPKYQVCGFMSNRKQLLLVYSVRCVVNKHNSSSFRIWPASFRQWGKSTVMETASTERSSSHTWSWFCTTPEPCRGQ